MANYPNCQKIIFIDDDVILNLIHRKILELIGFKGLVLDFPNGFQALEYIRKSPELYKDSVLIILDLEMPIFNGWYFLKCFEKLDTKIKNQFKIVVSSSSIDPVEIKNVLEFEIVADYIPKPLTFEIIKELIGSCNLKE